ncbi:MAG TPA: MOSC N-terminal beta barrel domain-containing protein [Polyangia bacterium]|nr:MOSC N-terminal beta barrel domain-containing protein [Polyangia bacterium]
MNLAEIWRYPVKSMGGEALTETWIDEHGIPGDRVVHVRDPRGRVVTSRSRPRLLLHRATLGADGEPRVDGRAWRSAAVGRDVEEAAGSGAYLMRAAHEDDDGDDRFDVLPLTVATDGAVAFLGYDRRRFRPNLLIAGVAGLAERDWEGGRLHIGDAVIGIVSLRQRCIMTTFDPDTVEQDKEVLLRIHRELGGTFALDCEVLQPGRVRVGDPVAIGFDRAGPA